MRASRLSMLLFLPLLIMSCKDNPAAPELFSEEGELYYRVNQFDNFPGPKPEVQVTYTNLEGKLIVETVQLPWEKKFAYEYSVTQDELIKNKVNLIVQYEGEDETFLIAKIVADEILSRVGLGKSIIMNMNGTLELPKEYQGS